MNVRLLEEAEEESREAARWYERRQQGLGAAFLTALATALEAVEKNPRGHGSVPGVPSDREIRRILLARFPYKVIYEILSSEVLVLAVAHARRDPDYWKSRESTPPGPESSSGEQEAQEEE